MTERNYYYPTYYPIPKEILTDISSQKEYGQKLLNRKRGKK